MDLMKRIVFFSFFLLLGTGAAGAAAPEEAPDLESYRWKNRLLLVFAGTPADPAYQALEREIQEQASGVRERELLVFRLLEQGPSSMPGLEISPAGARALRQRFRIAPGTFTAVLVGKDGGMKLKQEGKVTLIDIFGLIDSMPMRQREMQR